MKDRIYSCNAVSLWVFACLLVASALGCSTTRKTPDWIYYPPPPDLPRVVHLASVGQLDQLVTVESNWLDQLRGQMDVAALGTPFGLSYQSDVLYICDTFGNMVWVWDLRKGQARTIGEGVLRKPVDVEVDEQGHIYVADTIRGSVLQFARGGKQLLEYKIQQGPFKPVAVAVDQKKLYVCDMAHHRVQVFDRITTEPMGSIGSPGNFPGSLYYPSDIARSASGDLFVADMMNHRVNVYDAEGTFQRAIGEGVIGQPKALAVSKDGILLVADAGRQRILAFDPTGRWLLAWGDDSNTPGGTPLPNAIATTENVPETLGPLIPQNFHPDCFIWVSNTTGRYRLSLFAMGNIIATPVE